jgi:hypothetical protein
VDRTRVRLVPVNRQYSNSLSSTTINSLLHNPLNGVHTLGQGIHPRPIAQPDKVMTRRIEQIPTLTRVQIEEDTRNNNDLLLETGLEEVQPVGNALGQIRQVEPDVEGRVGHEGELESDLLQATDDEVALGTEVHLQRTHLVAHARRLEHADGGFLEGYVAAAVEVGAAAADGLDELLGTQDPGDAPAREAEALGKAVDNEHVVRVDIFDVVGGRDHSAIAVGRVVVAAVELIHDKSCAVAADVLNLGELRVGDHLTGGVTRVRSQDDGGTASNLGCDEVGRHVVFVVLSEGNGDGGDVTEEGQHLVVSSVVCTCQLSIYSQPS